MGGSEVAWSRRRHVQSSSGCPPSGGHNVEVGVLCKVVACGVAGHAVGVVFFTIHMSAQLTACMT